MTDASADPVHPHSVGCQLILPLADNRLGASRQSVNAIETGRYDQSLPLAFGIADLFGLPIEAIFVRD